MTRTDALTAALRYASQGFAVFPLYQPARASEGCTCRKGLDCASPGKHPRPRNGFLSASTDEAQIMKWWRKNPNANIGIATGRLSDLIIIDVDLAAGGDVSFDNLVDSTSQRWPMTLTAETGGGFHYWFRCPARAIASGTNMLGAGIDVRGEGGFIVAPPSLHHVGKRYQFVDSTCPVLSCPDWLADLLTGAKIGTLPAEGSPILEGSRNSTLTRIAGQLRANGMETEDIFVALSVRNESECLPPLPSAEVKGIAHSVGAYPAGTPRVQDFLQRTRSNPLWWMPFDLRHWNDSLAVAMMSAEEKGMYIQLLVRAWPYAGVLPDDRDALYRLSGASSQEAFDRASGLVLEEFEKVAVDGKPFLAHPMLSSRYEENIKSWEQKKLAGLKSAENRRSRRNETHD